MVNQNELDYIWRLDATAEGYAAYVEELPGNEKPDAMIYEANMRFLEDPEHEKRVERLQKIMQTRDIDICDYKFFLKYGTFD